MDLEKTYRAQCAQADLMCRRLRPACLSFLKVFPSVKFLNKRVQLPGSADCALPEQATLVSDLTHSAIRLGETCSADSKRSGKNHNEYCSSQYAMGETPS
jgi:hypothetical protein